MSSDNNKIICFECHNFVCYQMAKLSAHIIKYHEINLEQYFTKYKYDGNSPLCACGCGQKTKFRNHGCQFAIFFDHICENDSCNNRINPNGIKMGFKTCSKCRKTTTSDKYLHYNKPKTINCLICQNKFRNQQSLAYHLTHTHKMNLEQYKTQYIYNGQVPKCACGCGEEVSWSKKSIGEFNKYIKGHAPGWLWNGTEAHRKHCVEMNKLQSTETRKQASHKAVQTKIDNGTINHTAESKRKMSELRRIEYATGKRIPWQHIPGNENKVLEHIAKMHKSNAENITKLEIGKKFFFTKPEKQFKSILQNNKINFKQQYFIEGSNHPYDFYLPEYNLIVEIDGDFWHCNFDTDKRFSKLLMTDLHPGCKHKKLTINDIITKDIINTKYAIRHDYNIIRIWESDLHEKGETILTEIGVKHMSFLDSTTI